VPQSTTELVRWCQSRGIAVTAYGSLGGSGSKAGEVGPSSASANVAQVAERHACTSAQVLLRWALAQGVAVIPGATSANHIRDNLNVPAFALTATDRALLSAQAKPDAFTRWRNLSEEDRSWCKGCR
jgi:2,5-diketo-D-gluconate reductase B